MLSFGLYLPLQPRPSRFGLTVAFTKRGYTTELLATDNFGESSIIRSIDVYSLRKAKAAFKRTFREDLAASSLDDDNFLLL